jgi:hypothetical protein
VEFAASQLLRNHSLALKIPTGASLLQTITIKQSLVYSGRWSKMWLSNACGLVTLMRVRKVGNDGELIRKLIVPELWMGYLHVRRFYQFMNLWMDRIWNGQGEKPL